LISNDIINALFELTGGVLLFVNVWRLYRDKKIRGISILPVIVFTAWGFWNLYFYPSVGCVYSFLAGIIVVTANAIWLAQVFYYHAKRSKRD
jgi:hypothetical protein